MFALVVLTSCALAAATNPNGTEDIDLLDAPILFEKFIRDYHRVYKNEWDKESHYEAFVKNLIQINEENRSQPSATFGINKFADYTEAEKARLHGLAYPPRAV